MRSQCHHCKEVWRVGKHKTYFNCSFSDSLKQVLSEFNIVRPIRTNSKGHFLSVSVSANHLHQRKRHAHSTQDMLTDIKNIRSKRQTQTDILDQTPPIDVSTPSQNGHSERGQGYRDEEAELFYNVTVFGQELHLQLRPNSRLVAPSATMEWWEESGQKYSQPIQATDCFYTGEVLNMEDTSVAISNCDGLVGVIWWRLIFLSFTHLHESLLVLSLDHSLLIIPFSHSLLVTLLWSLPSITPSWSSHPHHSLFSLCPGLSLLVTPSSSLAPFTLLPGHSLLITLSPHCFLVTPCYSLHPDNSLLTLSPFNSLLITPSWSFPSLTPSWSHPPYIHSIQSPLWLSFDPLVITPSLSIPNSLPPHHALLSLPPGHFLLVLSSLTPPLVTPSLSLLTTHYIRVTLSSLCPGHSLLTLSPLNSLLII